MGVKMNTREGISFGSFIEDSINYQNEEVYALYAIIFLVLAVICTVYYQLPCLKTGAAGSINRKGEFYSDDSIFFPEIAFLEAFAATDISL